MAVKWRKKRKSHKSAMTSRAWPRPLQEAILIPLALLVVADFKYGRWGAPMVKTASAKQKSKGKPDSTAVDQQILLEIYRKIYTTRQFELKCIELYRQGLIYGYLHPYLGEEAVAAGACTAITRDDYIVSTHRGHGHCISKGADLKLMMAEIMGRATGYCKGRWWVYAHIQQCR